METKIHILVLLTLAGLSFPAIAEERTLTPEQMETLAKQGDFATEPEPERPGNLPDLTKGDVLKKGKGTSGVWTLGPTGIRGLLVGSKFQGDQIQVEGTLTGSI